LGGSLDPAVTFSRGTQATQYTSNGTLQYAPNNLLTYSNAPDNAAWTKSNSFVQTNLVLWSEDFTNAVWTKGNAGAGSVPVVTANQGVAPDGTLTADRIDFNCVGATNSDRSYIYQPVVSTNGVPYASSYYIKAFDAGSVGKTIRYTVETGVSSNQVIVTLTADWQRISNIFPAAGVGYNALLETRGTVTSSATASVLLWGAQIVQGSVPGDYVATTSAALPVLYADYNGVVRARKLSETTALNVHRISQLVTTANGTYTESVYLKAGERSKAFFILSDNATGSAGAYIDLAAGTVTADAAIVGSWTNISRAITLISNGWYRITVSGTCAAGTQVLPMVYLSDGASGNSSTNYTGDGSSGIYIADAQLEAGSTVQAYNDTTSAAYYGPRFDYDPTNLVRQNLLTYSEQFDNAIWVKSSSAITLNAAVSPDGTNNASLLSCITVAGGRITQVATTLTATNTFSGYAKAGNVSAITVLMYNVTTSAVVAQADVNLITGAVTNLTGACVTASLVSGWWRFALTNSSGVTSGNVINCYFYSGLSSAAVGSNVYIWGAQLNTGSTALTYFATTTAPYTLVAARGLLIEEQRANLLTYSDGTIANLTSSNNVTNATTALNPSFTNSIQFSDNTLQRFAYKVATTTAATVYTLSVFVCMDDNSTPVVGTTITSGDFCLVFEGNLISVASTVTALGNSTHRVQVTVTAAGGAGLNIGVIKYTGQSVKGFRITGFQLETGAFATSYIPTVGSQVTRAADSASITTLTPWFNATQGGFYAEYLINSFANSCAAVSFNASNSGFNVSGSGAARWWNGTTNISTANIVATGIIRKESFAYTASTRDICLAGSTVASDANAPWPFIPTAVYFGAAASGSSTQNINGWIRNVTYYPTRLPNATLQSITL
jgi:hypothetical protein